MHRLRGPLVANLALLAGSVLVALISAEVALRLAVEPAEESWGRLGRLQLPPRRLPLNADLADPDTPTSFVGDDGAALTFGDIYGLIREDRELGYVTLENARSARGWWESNNIGARSRTTTTPERDEGMRRVLVFGESFTHGSRVRQGEAWPVSAEEGAPGYEIVNLAVDGYSMAQAFLRYRKVRDLVEHDVVVVGFAPSPDLVRDVNTMRSLLGWESTIITPRFVLEGDSVELVRVPFENAAEVARVVREQPQVVFDHLARYDALYWVPEFWTPRFVGRLATYKVAVSALARIRTRGISTWSFGGETEALKVTRGVFDAMASEVRSRGQRFLLVYIPTPGDVNLHRARRAYRDRWASVTSHCPIFATCVDLMADFPDHLEVDFGVDGTHFGPRTNAWIGARVAEVLVELAAEEAYGAAPGMGSVDFDRAGADR